MCFGGIPSVVARLEFVIFSRLLLFVQMQGYPLLGNKMAASSSQAPFPDIRAELAELVKKKHDQTVSCQIAHYIFVTVSGFLAL